MGSLAIAVLSLGVAAVAIGLALLLRRLERTRAAPRAPGPTPGDNGGFEGSPVPAVPRSPLAALSARAEAEPEEERS
jgi:hypothetical protein